MCGSGMSAAALQLDEFSVFELEFGIGGGSFKRGRSGADGVTGGGNLDVGQQERFPVPHHHVIRAEQLREHFGRGPTTFGSRWSNPNTGRQPKPSQRRIE